jgi:hypothetical protein
LNTTQAFAATLPRRRRYSRWQSQFRLIKLI